MKKLHFSNDEDIIRLPRSFALPAKSLKLNVEPPQEHPLSAPSYQSHLPPPPEYRSNSLSYPSLNEFYGATSSSSKKLAIKKTHSDGSFGGLIPSPCDEENEEIFHPLNELPPQEKKPASFGVIDNFEDLTLAE